MKNKNRYHDDQEPSSSKTLKLHSLDDGVPEKTPKSSFYSKDEPQQANKPEYNQSAPSSESFSNQRAKEFNISSDDAAELNTKNSAEVMTKRKLSTSDADAPSAKREKASDIGKTDRGHGLKNTLHGVTYQLKLLILMLLQVANVMKVNKEFKCFISTEDPEFGSFDDIVLRFKDGDKWYLLCIQAKHKENGTQCIKWSDLTSTAKDNPYSISKYFNSYLQQKTDGTENTNLQPPTLVLCTNIGLEEGVKDLMLDEKHSFGVSLVKSFFKSLESKTFKFDLNKIKKKKDGKLRTVLEENSDFMQLAKQLAGCIFKGETIDFRNPLFKRYRSFIVNTITTNDLVSKDFYKLNEDFLTDDDDGGKDFRKYLEIEYRKLIEASTKQKTNSQEIWQTIQSQGIKVNKVA